MRMKMFTLLLLLLPACGCETLRFAPGQAQRQNAWLHHETARFAARQAQEEETSEQLQGLTDLSHQQSRAFVAYFGLPDELPAAQTQEDILAGAGGEIADQAVTEAAKRPDAWEVTDGFMELGIALAGLAGGAYGIRAARFLKEAKDKSKALREIVENNEALRQTSRQIKEAFGKAHQSQSPHTRKLVAEIKTRIGG